MSLKQEECFAVQSTTIGVAIGKKKKKSLQRQPRVVSQLVSRVELSELETSNISKATDLVKTNTLSTLTNDAFIPTSSSPVVTKSENSSSKELLEENCSCSCEKQGKNAFVSNPLHQGKTQENAEGMKRKKKGKKKEVKREEDKNPCSDKKSDDLILLSDGSESQWSNFQLLCEERILLRKEIDRIIGEFDLSGTDLVAGTLFVSNFRIFFVTKRNPLKVDCCVPLTTLSKLKKSKQTKVIEMHCKDLRLLVFSLVRTKDSRSQFMAELLQCIPQDPESFFAFHFKSSTVQITTNLSFGWHLYDALEDFNRMGIPNQSWRITEINTEFQLSSSYPSKIVVPCSVSDEELKRSAAFRSRGRIPVCIWRHPINGATLIRSSQPLVGLTRSRCAEDERLIAEILATNGNSRTLYISDSRPKVNAQMNTLKGMGYEPMSSYQNCSIEFFNIANIHVMRASLKKLTKVCRHWQAEINAHPKKTPVTDYADQVESTDWLEHLRKVLLSGVRVAELIDREASTVLCHCSDGWDRTAQTVALAELILDETYRTIAGFTMLIEKEFLSFGHKIAQRLGHDQHVMNPKDKERSPIFLQFIDCVWQVIHQIPSAFEFDSRMLIAILDHSYSCLFGTFLFNCTQERNSAALETRTLSLWKFIEENRTVFLNKSFRPVSGSLNSQLSVQNVCLWRDYYLRWSPEVTGAEYLPIASGLLLTLSRQPKSSNTANDSDRRNRKDKKTVKKSNHKLRNEKT